MNELVRVVWSGTNYDLSYSDSPALDLPVTSVHAFCFQYGMLLVIQHCIRGVDIPGGHVELNEEPLAALSRELREEACATARDLVPIGSIIVRRIGSSQISDRQYPDKSQMLMYRGNVDQLLPFDGEHESTGRKLLAPEQLPALHHAWNPVFQHVLTVACAAVHHSQR